MSSVLDRIYSISLEFLQQKFTLTKEKKILSLSSRFLYYENTIILNFNREEKVMLYNKKGVDFKKSIISFLTFLLVINEVFFFTNSVESRNFSYSS